MEGEGWGQWPHGVDASVASTSSYWYSCINVRFDSFVLCLVYVVMMTVM